MTNRVTNRTWKLRLTFMLPDPSPSPHPRLSSTCGCVHVLELRIWRTAVVMSSWGTASAVHACFQHVPYKPHAVQWVFCTTANVLRVFRPSACFYFPSLILFFWAPPSSSPLFLSLTRFSMHFSHSIQPPSPLFLYLLFHALLCFACEYKNSSISFCFALITFWLPGIPWSPPLSSGQQSIHVREVTQQSGAMCVCVCVWGKIMKCRGGFTCSVCGLEGDVISYFRGTDRSCSPFCLLDEKLPCCRLYVCFS